MRKWKIVARMRETRNAYKVLFGKHEVKRPLARFDSGLGPVAGCSEYFEPSGSINNGEYLD
jgi:hypothetical protein